MGDQSWTVARASRGAYDPGCLRLTQGPVPVAGDGEVIVEVKLLSLDPTNINWLKLDPVLQFLPIGIGDPMLGVGLGVVRESRAAGFAAGDVVLGTLPWRRYAPANPQFLQRALPEAEMPFEEQLALMSHIGLAATTGLFGIGALKASDAVLVSGAAGATGALAAQIAKGMGCYTVGVAGGAEKCRYLVEALGLDAAIDYKREPLKQAVKSLFPNGVDLFFDNVGGEILDVVLQNMAIGCRIALSGAISQYDVAEDAQLYGVRHLPLLLFRRARIEGFIAGQFPERNAGYLALIADLYRQGKVRAQVHILDGFEAAPEGLGMLLRGENHGKLMARL